MPPTPTPIPPSVEYLLPASRGESRGYQGDASYACGLVMVLSVDVAWLSQEPRVPGEGEGQSRPRFPLKAEAGGLAPSLHPAPLPVQPASEN